MIYWIIILSSAGFSISQLYKIKNKLALGITIVQIIAILFSLAGNFGLPYFVDIAWVIYVMSLFAVLFFSFYSDLTSIKKNIIILMTIPILITNIFQILHFPGAGWLGISCVISLGIYFWMISNRKDFADELGFLTMMAADALIIFLIRIIWLV